MRQPDPIVQEAEGTSTQRHGFHFACPRADPINAVVNLAEQAIAAIMWQGIQKKILMSHQVPQTLVKKYS